MPDSPRFIELANKPGELTPEEREEMEALRVAQGGKPMARKTPEQEQRAVDTVTRLMRPQWGGRRVVSDGHLPDLEHRAALYEFRDGLGREEAERRAYEDYRKEHHRAAAAHHLRGMRAAQGSGDLEEARKHGLAYGLHLRALDLDPMDEVPAEIRALAEGDDRKSHYRFKTHAADALLLQEP